jgi:hypothetical protein
MVNIPERMPGYCGLKLTGTVQTVPAGLTPPPRLQPVTVPIVNSATPLCDLGTEMPLMAVADCRVNRTFCADEVDPTAVVGNVANAPPATAEE